MAPGGTTSNRRLTVVPAIPETCPPDEGILLTQIDKIFWETKQAA